MITVPKALTATQACLQWRLRVPRKCIPGSGWSVLRSIACVQAHYHITPGEHETAGYSNNFL